MAKKILIFILSLALSSQGFSQILPGGIYPVGTGNTYTNLTDIAAILKTNTLTGNVVFELQSTYASGSEIFPVIFKQFNSSGGNWRVTIRPATGVSITTEGNPGVGNALITLDSTDRITFDGRAGGSGPIAWTIRNKCADNIPIANPVLATSAGPAIQLINEATFDTLTYLQVEGMSGVAASAVIFFGASTGTLGNSYNGISYCNIRDRSDTLSGTATPAACIISNGTSASISNNYNTVAYNNISNFFYPHVQNHAIRVNNSSAWSILYNRIFQELPRVYVVGNNHKGIRLDNSSGINFSVIGNVIGYSSAAGTGSYDMGGSTSVFSGMDINLGYTAPSVIKKNILTNFQLTTSAVTNGVTSSPSGVFVGLNINQGDLIIDSNIIGSATDTSSIKVICNLGGAGIYGISVIQKKAVITNNIVGGITIDNAAPGPNRALFYGISAAQTGGTTVISNNLIGSRTTPNSVMNRSGLTNITTGHTTIGLFYQSSPATVTNNTIANMAYSGGSTTAQVIGINIANVGTVAHKTGTGTNGSGNEIYNLINSAPNTGVGVSASVIGILNAITTAGQLITQNHIYSLYNTSSTGAVTVTGLQYVGNTANSGDVISRNFIHSLVVQSSATTSAINGINTGTSTANYQNNMISLGFDSAGTTITNGYAITGINNVSSGTGTDSYYHNTVHIGGTNVSTGSNTYAFNRAATPNTTNLVNNILVNTRSNGTGSANHVVFRNNNTLNAGLNSNYNLYYRNGNGGALFQALSTNYDSLASWQLATSPTLDMNSGVGNPQLINPEGSATTIDLRVQNSNTIESAGTPIATVTTDFDNNSRSNNTPVDIGASSGTYTRSSDVFPPAISYQPLGNGAIATARTATGFNITDNSSVSAALNAPRLYYKKTTDLDQFNGNGVGIAGWKYVTAINNVNPYSFTIDYNSLFSGAVFSGDTIQYFIVAQDAAGNLGYFPVAAFSSGVPPVQSVNQAPRLPSRYVIMPDISGIKTVCTTGCDYNSLTRVGGLFQAVDSLAVIGDINASIQSDLFEDGTYGLTYFGGEKKLTIKPDANVRTISNATMLSSITPLINISGAANVTIDGIAGRLIFKNTNSTPANTSTTIQFTGGASNDTIRNCIIQNNGSTTSRANIVIGSGTTGNNNIVITQNDIGDTSVASTQSPAVCIISNLASNNNLRITNNNIYNFTSTGISMSAFGSNCTIGQNSIYNNRTAVIASAQTGISISSGTGYIITGNYIGGRGPLLSGGLWINGSNGPNFGITTSTPGAITIQGNEIGFISDTILSATVAGINASSSANPYIISQNSIHDITSIGTNSGAFISLGGILISGTNANNVITQNTIYNLKTGVASGNAGVSGIGVNGSSANLYGVDINRNTIYNFLMNASSTGTPDFRGIGPIQGNNISVTNNFVSLGSNISNDVTIEGIWNSAATTGIMNVNNNSVYISGNVTGTALKTTTCYQRSNVSLCQLYNNILYNTRTFSAGTPWNVSIANLPTTGTANGWNSNYNINYTLDTTSTLGIWGTTLYGLNGFRNISLYDQNSKSMPVFFNNAANGDLHLSGSSVGNYSFAGIPVAGVTTDYDGQTRSTLYPYIGADEIPGSPLPVKLLSFSAQMNGKNIDLSWITASELNNTGFEIQRSNDGRVFENIRFIPAGNKTSTRNRYTYADQDPFAIGGNNILYYRLKQMDADGSFSYSNIASVSQRASNTLKASSYPNPFHDHLSLKMAIPANTLVNIHITDIYGKSVYNQELISDQSSGLSLNSLSILENGLYYITVYVNGTSTKLKVIKAD